MPASPSRIPISVGAKAPDGLFHLRFPLGNPPAPLAITTTTLKIGAVSQSPAYSDAVAATGGVAPYIYGIAPGSASTLPPGLSLNSSTGAITGVATVNGTFVITFQVIDTLGTPSTQVISLTINPAFTKAWPDPLPNGQVGVFYSFQLATTGGILPVTSYFLASGTLPSGITLDPITGIVSGTPTTPITFDAVSFGATDSA